MKIKRLFNLNTMSQELCEKKVGKVAFGVYSAIFVLLFLSVFFITPEMYTSMTVFYANLTAMIIFTLAWLSLAYIVNKKGDGKDFWYRFIGLNITITILLGIALFIIGIFYGIYLDATYGIQEELPKMGWFDFSITTLPSIIYLYLIYKYMQLVSHGCNKSDTSKKI